MQTKGRISKACSEGGRSADQGARGCLSKLEPPHKSFVNLNFKVDDWWADRFKYEAALRNMTQKELIEAALLAYLVENGGTIDKPRKNLVERFKGRTTHMRRSRRKFG